MFSIIKSLTHGFFWWNKKEQVSLLELSTAGEGFDSMCDGVTVQDGVCEVGYFLPLFFELKISQTHPSLLINSIRF